MSAGRGELRILGCTFTWDDSTVLRLIDMEWQKVKPDPMVPDPMVPLIASFHCLLDTRPFAGVCM